MKTPKYYAFIAAVGVFALLATFLLLGDEYESNYFRVGPRTGAEDQRLLRAEDQRLLSTEITDSSNNILATHEWPADEISNIPEGIYVSTSSSPRLSTPAQVNHGRVLLYVTTHMSEQHLMYLKYCWPNILARSAVLREADVAVYLNPEEKGRKQAMDILKDVFAGQNLKVYLRAGKDAPGAVEKKELGANLAMHEAVTSNFFFGYDWVVRLNPDVIVRDDSFLIESMADPSIDALVIACEKVGPWMVNTDFFVINPQVLHAESFPVSGDCAEWLFFHSIKESVLDKNTHRWIPNSNPTGPACRAGDGREFFESPIIHQHHLHPDICSVPSDVDLSHVFKEGWPTKWKKAF